MTFGLPSIGETGWGQKVLDSINFLKGEQDGRLSDAALLATIETVGADNFTRLPEPTPLAGPIPAGGQMDLSRQVFNLKGWHLRKARAGLAKVGAGRYGTDLVCVGDSNTHGLGSYFDVGTVAGTSWPARLAAKLEARGLKISSDGIFWPAGADGQDPRWTTTGAAGEVNGLLASFDGGASGTWTPSRNCHRFRVTYLNEYAGSFTITIDGGTPTTVTRTATGGYNRWEGPELTYGAHSITITADPAGSVHVASIEAVNWPGVAIGKAGVSGSTADGWAQTGAQNLLDNVLALFPTTVVVMLGSNDVAATATEYATDIQGIVTRCRATGAEVLVVGPPPRLEKSFDEFYAALYPLALSMDFPLLDLRERYGDYSSAKAAGIFTDHAGDTVHLSAAGADDLASAVLAILYP